MTTLEHWNTWREKCALGLCPDEVRDAMRAFAGARFHRFAAIYANATNTPDARALTPAPAEAWHWFETYLRLHNTREGKCYKQWLFAHADTSRTATLDTVQSGATLLMRTVVQERLRREFSGRRVMALDAPIRTADGETAPSLRDLLPGNADPANDVEERELRDLADKEAAKATDVLNRRERVALLARQLGLSLAHPAVTRTAGCGHSMLNAAFHQALLSLAIHVRSRYRREHPSALAALTCLVYKATLQHNLRWGKSEKACARLFLLVEHEPVD